MSTDKPTIIKEYRYKPQEDLIQLEAPHLIVVRYGTITNNEEENTTESKWILDCFNDMKRLVGEEKLNVLVDLSRIDSGEYNSAESNKIYRSIMRDAAVNKVAVFGLPSGWQMLIDVLVAFIPHKLKVLHSEVEAREWLERT